MKKSYLILLFSMIFLGCQSIFHQGKLVKEYKGYNDSNRETAFKVYKDNNLFYIIQNNEVIYKNLKFVKLLDANTSNHHLFHIQVLDEKNRKKVLTLKSKLTYSPNLACGTGVQGYTLKSKKNDNGFLVEIEAKSFMTKRKTVKFVDINSSRKIDELLFINLKKKYSFSSLANFSKKIHIPTYTLIGKINGKYKIIGKIENSWRINKGQPIFKEFKNNTLYDNITNAKGLLLLKKNNLVGYYRLTDIKYLSLEPFDNYLAKFKLPDGREGYVDIGGHEYYK